MSSAKKPLREDEGMSCRVCNGRSRASEGYPCLDCGTFICLRCSFRGEVRCRACADTQAPSVDVPDRQPREWPEH